MGTLPMALSVVNSAPVALYVQALIRKIEPVGFIKLSDVSLGEVLILPH